MFAPDNTIPVGAVVVNVPPQTVADALARVIPVGKVSEKATPVRAEVLAAGLVRVNVNDEVAFTAIPVGLKAFPMAGGAITFRLAEAVPPVPPSDEVMFPVVLFCVPALMPVTLMEKVQDALEAIVAPERLITLVAWVAVMVPPPQAPVIPFGVETTKPEGKVSLKAMPLTDAAGFALFTVKLSAVEPFNGTLAAPNDLISTGGATTVTAALEVFPVPASVDVVVTELFFTPAVTPMTSTEIVQEELTAKVPPARLTVEAPGAAVIVPVQVVITFGVIVTFRPAGRLSVKAIPVSARLALGLAIVKVSAVVPLIGTDAAANALEMVCALTVPVPVSARVCGLLAASSVTLKVATFAPTLPGENITLIVHVAVLATLAPQVVVSENSEALAPVIVMDEMLSVAPELLLSVITRAALEVPTAWFPNARLVGVKSTGSDCKKMETFAAPPLVKARSKAPSPLKSAVAAL